MSLELMAQNICNCHICDVMKSVRKSTKINYFLSTDHWQSYQLLEFSIGTSLLKYICDLRILKKWIGCIGWCWLVLVGVGWCWLVLVGVGWC